MGDNEIIEVQQVQEVSDFPPDVQEAAVLPEIALAKVNRDAPLEGCAPFACGGTLVPDQPLTLCFRDKTQLPVLRAPRVYEQEQLLQPLVKRCTPAPFGKGRQTRYDRSVRNALQLNAEGGAFSVLHFDPQAAGILEQIRRELVPQDPSPLSAELYSLNIYASDGHFVPHKDTPRGSDMLGTLVVCLPSQFSNGALVVKHRGVFQTFDWSAAVQQQAEPTRLHWAAFFGDVDHQIERVWSGLRVTVTYLLRRDPESTPLPVVAPEARPTLVQDKLRALLADRRFLPRGGTLAFPCSHLYHQDARFQRPLEYADLRHNDGYAVRLKGITTVMPSAKDTRK